MHITDSIELWDLADSVVESLVARIAAGDLAVTPNTPSQTSGVDNLKVGLYYFFNEVETRLAKRLGGAPPTV